MSNITVPRDASLPALKTLFLWYVKFAGFGFESLLSCCPVLEDLTLLDEPWDWEDGKQCRVVSCPTLKRFIISWKDITCNVSRSITFDTPSLAYLEYHDFVADEYPTVNLSSLVEAKLEMKAFGKSNPRNLIKGLSNVKILELTSHETAETFYSFAEAIPVFENLSRLSIVTGVSSCWRFVSLLLKKCPKIEKLVINGYLHYSDEYRREELESLCQCLDEYSFLRSYPVKVLEIAMYGGTKGDLEQMKLILEKSPCLELVKIHACKGAELSFAMDLLRLPEAGKSRLEFFPSPC